MNEMRKPKDYRKENESDERNRRPVLPVFPINLVDGCSLHATLVNVVVDPMKYALSFY